MTIRQIIAKLIRWLQHLGTQWKRNNPHFYQVTQKREWPVVVFFMFLIFTLLVRLFALQILQAKEFDQKLLLNHRSVSNLKAQRWHIYVTDRSGAWLALTENITLYNVYVEPPYIKDKKRMIDILTPLVYLHLCQINGFDKPNKEWCVRNIESFSKKELLPKVPEIMYYGQGVMSSGYNTFDWTGYNDNFQKVLTKFTTGQAHTLINERLTDLIRIGKRESNYVAYITDKVVLDRLKELNKPYISLIGNYVYIIPDKVPTKSKAQSIKEVSAIFSDRWFDDIVDDLASKFNVQNYWYIKLISDVHPAVIDALNKLKLKYYKTLVGWIPLLHAVGTESYVKRYYPYRSFMSHIIGYLWAGGMPYYGVEEYFDNILKGVDGRIEWRSSAWMGQVWANDFTIKNVKDGYDVYLTIDPVIQRQIESISMKYRERFRADSISVLVYNPWSGQVIASANAPFFDPNKYNEVYELKPLAPEQRYLLDDTSHVDFPVYIQTWWETRLATSFEREDPSLPKYVTANPLGPNLFIDKNIAFPYEPWSIFKAFTYGIGLDTKEISMYDQYDDPKSEIKVWPYTIRNAEKEACMGTHSFLYALQHSCNVWMVRISQKLTKNTFYNYIEKLWFGAMTHIELAGEDPGFVESVSSVSLARYFNNNFWQWLLTTPIQIAAAYGALLNGGSYIKPTILDKICESWTEECQHNKVKVLNQIFDPAISEEMKFSLMKVIEIPVNGKYSDVPPYQLWWKSWTSQISYKGKYLAGAWWTNGSFVGMVTKDNLKYLVVIQVRRPRSSQRWNQTAWAVFKDTASFLINYEIMQGQKFEKKATITDYSKVKDAGIH